MASRVTVFGGDGFIGRYVVQALLKEGALVCVASRNPKRGWLLKTQGNLGQMAFTIADVTKPDTLGAAVANADVVINLVGSFANMDKIQREGAGNVARAAAQASVGKLIHLSAIGADCASPSAYGRSKGDGEAAVRAEFPSATILRPSIVFGREDSFINRFASLIRMLPIVPIFAPTTRFQPVYVGDVAKAVIAAITDSKAQAQTFELGGPESFSMEALNRRIAHDIGREKTFLPVPNEAGAAFVRVTSVLPGAPMSWDQWLMLQKDNVVAPGAKGLETLGIAATPLEAVTPGWLVQYRKHGRFGAMA